MKALITGISGRVGPNLAHQMKRRGYEIRGLVMPGRPASGTRRRGSTWRYWKRISLTRISCARLLMV